MRVTVLSGAKGSGAKRVTIAKAGVSRSRIVRENASKGVYEPLKISIIHPTGRVERGELRLDVGAVKKSSRPLRPIERVLRKVISAEHKALGRYLLLHDRSRRKERNGWASDLGSNVVKAIRR